MVSITDLINIVSKIAKSKKDNTVFYFIEPAGEKMKVTNVKIAENVKPVTVW